MRIFLGIYLIIAGIWYILCNPVNTEVHLRVKRWEQFSNLTFTFSCINRSIGFYADVEHNCQIFHMCDEKGHRIPHICANETRFNQEFRICDWEYNFRCSDSEKWFYLNELTYVTEMSDDSNNLPPKMKKD